MTQSDEFFISVDVETSGANPADYALLSIGACTLDEPPQTFYIELKPTSVKYRPEALAISGLSLESLQETGVPVEEALHQFEQWVHSVTPQNMQSVFAAFNAPFDWMFVNDYFLRYLGHNPFGHKALDIKALYMGIFKTSWDETSYHKICESLGINAPLSHHALDDALQQAALLKILLKESGG
ncbi:MAG: 3'-5' exonuclease [Anaerolineales bacterium]|nr:3'-5' exonuclease [Anaerolineales bacterium]